MLVFFNLTINSIFHITIILSHKLLMNNTMDPGVAKLLYHQGSPWKLTDLWNVFTNVKYQNNNKVTMELRM